MKIKYITIDISNLSGMNKVDRYLRNGWTVYRGGMFSTVLQKKS